MKYRVTFSNFRYLFLTYLLKIKKYNFIFAMTITCTQQNIV